jgi:hypothetical protein
MRGYRSVIPVRTSRRDILLAAGSTLALQPSAPPQSSGESYLELLLRRRGELERLVVGFSEEVNRLKASNCTPSSRRRLYRTRRAEARASQALERLEWVIVDTPAETLDDVALKLRFCAELQGYGGEPAGCGRRSPSKSNCCGRSSPI